MNYEKYKYTFLTSLNQVVNRLGIWLKLCTVLLLYDVDVNSLSFIKHEKYNSPCIITPHKYDAAVYNDYSKQMKICITIYTIRVMQMIDICGI